MSRAFTRLIDKLSSAELDAMITRYAHELEDAAPTVEFEDWNPEKDYSVEFEDWKS